LAAAAATTTAWAGSKFAVVDEDKSPLADFLRGAGNQGKAPNISSLFFWNGRRRTSN